MKIISKRKDYYDYVAGHDTDPRKVYVRQEGEIGLDLDERYDHPIIRSIKEFTHHGSGLRDSDFFIGAVWFCDQFYLYLLYEGKYYYGYENVPEHIVSEINKGIARRAAWYRKDRLKEFMNSKGEKWQEAFPNSKYNLIKRKLNTEYGQPVVFSHYPPLSVSRIVENGILKDIEFSQVKSPQEAYQELYNWIPYHEPDMPSDPTDMGRFENKGFDKKTSFRNIK